MASEENGRPTAGTDHFRYSRAALARLVISAEQRDLADRAAAGVPTDDTFAKPGDLVEEAQTLVALAQDVLRSAVIYERETGTNWEEIGERLGVSKQAVHGRYADAVQEWKRGLIQPYYPATGSSLPAPRLHEAALDPTATGAHLDRWARATVPAARDHQHPVTGHLPPLTTVEEMTHLLAAIQHLYTHGAGPAERADAYERKAALLERIAHDEGRDPGMGADEARTIAAQLRAEANAQGSR